MRLYAFVSGRAFWRNGSFWRRHGLVRFPQRRPSVSAASDARAQPTSCHGHRSIPPMKSLRQILLRQTSPCRKSPPAASRPSSSATTSRR